MKKILSLALAGMMVFAMSGCSSSANVDEPTLEIPAEETPLEEVVTNDEVTNEEVTNDGRSEREITLFIGDHFANGTSESPATRTV